MSGTVVPLFPAVQRNAHQQNPARHSAAPDPYAASRDLVNYWQVLRGTRLVPARREFDPRGIERTLASCFVAERVAPGVARIRVAGSQLNTLLGMDVRGMPISAFFDPAARDLLAEALRAMHAQPQHLTVSLISKGGFARRSQSARMVLLPLSDAQGMITRMVGCLDTGSAVLRAPRRFQITGMHAQDLYGTPPAGLPPVQPQDYPLPTAPQQQAMAEPPAVFKTSRRRPPASAPRKAHLSLVVENA